MKHLVLGGARSGKSRFAERRATELFKHRTAMYETSIQLQYVATATACDEEMQERIAHHQVSRHDLWHLIESPLKLADTLLALERESKKENEIEPPHNIIVIDCLTLWLSNALHADVADREIAALLEVLPRCNSDIILVSNEVGSGIVPMGKLSRDFVDYSGRLHQALAEICDDVSVIVAGLPLVLKKSSG